MKSRALNPLALLGTLLGGILFATGCGHLDLTPPGDPNRIVSGAVNFNRTVPAGAELVVRIVDASTTQPDRPRVDLPVSDFGKPPPAERVLGESVQKLAGGGSDPVAFRVEFQADDALLRRGLNLEARVSFGGRVRFRTLTAHVVTLASSPYPHELLVESIER